MTAQNKLENLNVEHKNIRVGRSYSWFVKFMRFALPLAAIILAFVAFALPKMKQDLVVIPKEELVQQPSNEIGENELLNPHFETVDSNQNPINVTAIKALQSQENPNLVKLEKPNAQLKTKDGSNITIQAINGTYEQKTEKLFLQENVIIEHAAGYTLNAKELRVDLKTREAFSNKEIKIEGPAANIKSIGLKGNMDNGTLIFQGPATLTIKKTSPPLLKTEP